MGCSYFQGVPPSAIGLSIILLILTGPPHASVQTSILGESDGGPSPWLSLSPLSVGEALPHFDAALRNEAALASLSLSTSARSSCSCGCAIADLSINHISGGPKALSWYHVHHVCRRYRVPGSRNSRGSCTTHAASTGSASDWSQKQNGIQQKYLARLSLPPRGEPRSLISNISLLTQSTLVLFIRQ